jgi:chorismate synthase
MKIVFSGPKGSGKSTVGKVTANLLGLDIFETDIIIEEIYKEKTGNNFSCREICRQEGEKEFRRLELEAVRLAALKDWCVISTGGSTMLNTESRNLLREDSIFVFIYADVKVLLERILRKGTPSYLKSDNPEEELSIRLEKIKDVLLPYADVIVDTSVDDIDTASQNAVNAIAAEVARRGQMFSCLGNVVKISTFGESHGKGLGAVLDGIKPGFPVDEEYIQKELDRRRPGQSKMTTARNEADRVEILSGVFEGKTTGAPIGLLIRNKDQDSSKYDNLKELFRPGHADFTFWKKYGIRDHRGGGRSSGRETAARVAGGAIVRNILEGKGVTFTASAIEVAGVKAENFDADEIEKNTLRCADAYAAEKMKEAVLKASKEGESVGGIVELKIKGVPAGLGDPVFGKLDARLAHAMFSLGAVKGVEFGGGFELSKLNGTQSNDQMDESGFLTNSAGGILGGISNGEEIILRVAVKPTPSVFCKQKSTNKSGEAVDVKIEGRHDPCIVPRIIPVIESMAALVFFDVWTIQEHLKSDFPVL